MTPRDDGPVIAISFQPKPNPETQNPGCLSTEQKVASGQANRYAEQLLRRFLRDKSGL